MKELKKQHLEMLQLLESIEVMLQNGNSIHPNSVIRGAIQTAIGMEVDVTNVNDKCDNKQTAVEWFWLNLTDDVIGDLSPEKILKIHELIKQAKAMEKEQIKDALQEFLDITLPDEVCEKYYNETFKSE